MLRDKSYFTCLDLMNGFHHIKVAENMIYLDDILIITDTAEEHLLILEQVLTLMVNNLLELRIDKCSFMQVSFIWNSLLTKLELDQIPPM